MAVLLTHAERDFSTPSAVGRKKLSARDKLLEEVVKKLREAPMKADAARLMARDVLTSCGIEMPKQLDSIERAAGKGTRKK